MTGETSTQQSEVNINRSERMVLPEKESRLRQADTIIEAVRLKTMEIRHQDELVVVLSEMGIKNINEYIDPRNIKESDTGYEEVVKPSFANISEIERSIKSLKELGLKFGCDQDTNIDDLKDILTQLRLSPSEEVTKRLVLQAENIFLNNVTGLLNKHAEIAYQQEGLGELYTTNGRKLEIKLDENFKGDTIRKIDQGPVGFYIRQVVKPKKELSTIFENSVTANNKYRNTLMSFSNSFSEVMNSFITNNSDNNDQPNPFS